MFINKLKIIFSLVGIITGAKSKELEDTTPKIKLSENSTLPNFIIFLADDLGYGDLGVSGHPTSRTPNIDYVARRSRYFHHFYVTSPVCTPSRSSLLTGRYQIRSGSYPGIYTPSCLLGLPPNETTIAKLLKEEGYRTQIVGKWHLGVGANREYLPSNPKYGFDDYLGIPYSHGRCPCHACFPKNESCYGACLTIDDTVSCPLFSNERIIEQPAYLPDLTEKLLQRALEFIRSSTKNRQPFFLYFAFHHMHYPQFASEKWAGKSIRGHVGDSLSEIDSVVASVVKYLKKMNQLENTMVWFTSDNGPSLEQHERGGCAGLLRCGKGTTWDGGIKVPAFVYWKDKIIPGRSNSLVSSLDILPTMASIIGKNTRHLELDGFDISKLLFNPSETPRDFFAAYSDTPDPKVGPFAVVYKNFKAHFYTKGTDISDRTNYDQICRGSHPLTCHEPPLLFDLYEDPGERYNLADQEEFRDLIQFMRDWRDQHMANMTWMSPRTQTFDERAQPCCNNPKCEPFPSCCDCRNSVNKFHGYHFG